MLRPVQNVASNLPPGVIVGLRDRYGLVQAVETGTCHGGTAMMLGLAFRTVETVEFDPEVYQWPVELLGKMQNVQRDFADSRLWIARKDWSREPPTLFYLDAHPTRETTWMPPSSMPVLDELRAIGGLHGKHAIVVDDFWAYESLDPVVKEWSPKPARFSRPADRPGEYCFQALTLDECPWGEWL